MKLTVVNLRLSGKNEEKELGFITLVKKKRVGESFILVHLAAVLNN